MTDSSIADPARTAARLMGQMHLRDGLPEMFMGVMWLALGAGNWLVVLAPSSRIGHEVFGGIYVGLCLAFAVFCLMSASLLKWIRSRFLIQYRGYVKTSPSPEQKRRRAWAYAKSSIIAGIVSALTIYALARWRSYGLGGWFLVILGALFCAANMYYRPLRFKVNGILALAAGLFLAFRRIPLNTGIPIFFTFVGCLSLISGLFVLLRFMREAKEAAQA
ncbi:MAG: hypothetical protein WCF17_06040 [Terracidiphilus sp.]